MITTIEQEKKLRELGFNGDVLHYYNSKEELEDSFCYDIDRISTSCLLFDFNNEVRSIHIGMTISAPTISDALQWIRENKKEILFKVDCFYSSKLKNIGYQGIILNRNALRIKSKTIEYPSYPLAESALLDAVLDYLIEKKDE